MTALALYVLSVLLAPVRNVAPNATLVIVAVAVSLLALREIGVLHFWMPENRRLVPETVFRLGDFFGPLQFGIEMGSGARTYVSSSIPYMLVVLVFWSGDLTPGVAAAAGFALGRQMMTVLSVVSGESSKWDEHYRQRVLTQRLGLVLFLGLAAILLVYGN